MEYHIEQRVKNFKRLEKIIFYCLTFRMSDRNPKKKTKQNKTLGPLINIQIKIPKNKIKEVRKKLKYSNFFVSSLCSSCKDKERESYIWQTA